MFNKGQLAGLMKQAQSMQDNLKKAQDELGNIEVEGESGAGLVKVVMTCKHDVKRITIDPSFINVIFNTINKFISFFLLSKTFIKKNS